MISLQWIKLSANNKRLDLYNLLVTKENSFDERLESFKNKIKDFDGIIEFNDELFESLIDSVIIGDKESNTPYAITFVYNVVQRNDAKINITKILNFDYELGERIITFEKTPFYRKKYIYEVPICVAVKI